MSGDDGEVDTPVPIPNTEVKHFSAEDSTMCENRSLPGKSCIFFYKNLTLFLPT